MIIKSVDYRTVRSRYHRNMKSHDNQFTKKNLSPSLRIMRSAKCTITSSPNHETTTSQGTTTHLNIEPPNYQIKKTLNHRGIVTYSLSCHMNTNLPNQKNTQPTKYQHYRKLNHQITQPLSD